MNWERKKDFEIITIAALMLMMPHKLAQIHLDPLNAFCASCEV